MCMVPLDQSLMVIHGTGLRLISQEPMLGSQIRALRDKPSMAAKGAYQHSIKVIVSEQIDDLDLHVCKMRRRGDEASWGRLLQMSN